MRRRTRAAPHLRAPSAAVQASPRARLDAVEALALYDPTNDLLSSPTGKAWLQKKQAQREKLRV
jgi:hypothetical protein